MYINIILSINDMPICSVDYPLHVCKVMVAIYVQLDISALFSVSDS